MNYPRILAAYLPQFHPIPENDIWWGKGFTEWTNVGKAQPLFKGHYQPRVPSDLGYYDLRIPEVREAQASLARDSGIAGFCYWHYWFGNGKRLLEMPFNEVLNSGKPDFPFCLAWANSSWQGVDHGVHGRQILIKQEYPGTKDFEAHFHEILPALKDPRYITVDDKPFLMIFTPGELPDARAFIDLWQNLAVKNGLKGIYFVGQTVQVENIPLYLGMGFDSINIVRLRDPLKQGRSIFTKFKRRALNELLLYNYGKATQYFSGPEDYIENVIPSIIPNWDNTPRTGKKGYVLHDSTPESFKKHVKTVLDSVSNKPDQKKLVYLKSWNEWAEGNYMEPDMKFGRGYLDALKECLG